VADKQNVQSHIFTATREEDRMNGHIMACVTARVDGTLKLALMLMLMLHVAICFAALFLVDCCVCADLLFVALRHQEKKTNVKLRVTNGACGPVTIHSDGSQIEEKKQAERKQRRSGETPEEANVKSRFVEGMDSPGVSAQTSKKGSMTQEIFHDFTEHFVGSLPKEHVFQRT
jgi:hypothetical protein